MRQYLISILLFFSLGVFGQIETFPTVLDAAGITYLGEGSLVKTEGYFAAGDGGGALYKITKAANIPAASDQGYVYPMTNGDYLVQVMDQPWINTATFGIVCGNTAQAASNYTRLKRVAAVANALDYHIYIRSCKDTIYVEFPVNDTITINNLSHKYLIIAGDGEAATVLKAHNSTGEGWFKFSDPDRVSFFDLTVVGYDTSPYGGIGGATQKLVSDTTEGWITITGTKDTVSLKTGEVTPSGISGSIQFNTGGNFDSSDSLYWDDTNGRLGIGTSSPVEELHIESNNPGIRFTNTGSSAYSNIAFGNQRLEVVNNLGGRLTHISKNFGINKQTPAATLHVQSSGITSATTALKVDDNVGNELFSVRDDGQIKATAAGLTISSPGSGATTYTSSRHLFTVASTITSGIGIGMSSGFGFTGGTFFSTATSMFPTGSTSTDHTIMGASEIWNATTSGKMVGTTTILGSNPGLDAKHTGPAINLRVSTRSSTISTASSWRGVSTGTYAAIVIDPIINQQPGATGTVYGIDYNPTLTSVLGSHYGMLIRSGQVGVGTPTPDASAIIDITSTTQGLLPPRQTTAQRDAIPTPAEGLFLYNTTNQRFSGRDASSWRDLAYTSDIDSTRLSQDSILLYYVAGAEIGRDTIRVPGGGGGDPDQTLSWNGSTGEITISGTGGNIIDIDGRYLQSFTETDPVVGAINGIVKANGAGVISAAVAGTDYAAASHTHVAADITDFDTEVSNNTDVAANTSARHDAVTVTDGSEVDFTLTGQNITASILNNSITFAKIQDISTATLLGRATAGTGDPEQITIGGGLELSGASLQRQALTGAITATAGSNATSLGSFTKAQLSTAVSDGTPVYSGDNVSLLTNDAGYITTEVDGSTTNELQTLGIDSSDYKYTVSLSLGGGSVDIRKNDNRIRPFRQESLATTSTEADGVIAVNGVNVTLSSADAAIVGRVITVKNRHGSTAVTVDTEGSETIDGAATSTVNATRAITYISDGSNWMIIGSY